MIRLMKSVFVAAVIGGVVAGAAAMAAADDAKPKAPATQPSKPVADKPAPPPAPPPTPPTAGSAAAEVHAGTGYEKHAVVGEAATFPTGTKVFVGSLVTGANGTQVKHVWKKDGAELWTATLSVGSNKWTTSSRRVLAKAGAYEVDVVGADGSELGKVEFAIQ
jgi:hypothetical protein